MAATLRAAGARLRLPKGADPSLPLALGGVGITLRDAASLYAALATKQHVVIDLAAGGTLGVVIGVACTRRREGRR